MRIRLQKFDPECLEAPHKFIDIGWMEVEDGLDKQDDFDDILAAKCTEKDLKFKFCTKARYEDEHDYDVVVYGEFEENFGNPFKRKT